MKRIIAFFVVIYNWFLSLFKTKEDKEFAEIEKKVEELKWSGKAITPSHNNRKRTKGRHIQSVSGKTIYHGAK